MMTRRRRSTGGAVLALELVLAMAAGAAAPAHAANIPLGDATIELLSGSKVSGQITAKDEDRLTVVMQVGGRVLTRQFPLEGILAVSVGGTRYVLNGAEGSTADSSSESAASPPLGSASKPIRSKAEVEELIRSVGRTPPDWYDSVPLEYPRSLDLDWPQPPPTREWNNQKNVGQYVWDVINPNPGKWRSGVRFMHFMLERHAGSAVLRTRVMDMLGRMYFDFFRDYPRAAFWWRAAGVDKTQSPEGVRLAECYWRMGSEEMAKDLLDQLPLYYQAIKLWADMGETEKALRVAGAFHQSGYTDMAYLSAGDACRTIGRLDDAISYYESVLTLPAVGRMAPRIQRNQDRAQANIEGIQLYDSLDLRRVPDGKYSGKAPAYGGDLFVEVTIAGGRIVSVAVTRHQEKQFYSAFDDTACQIVEAQGFRGIDATTGATITSEAIINAAARALAGAVK